MFQLISHSVEQTEAAGEALGKRLGPGGIIAFFGGMGMGKTVLTRGIVRGLGSRDAVSSPTFAIVNEYSTADGEPVYHFDFYRLNDLREVYDIGYEEYFYSGCYCFTEWTEKIEDLLPEHYVRVEITEAEGVRTLEARMINE